MSTFLRPQRWWDAEGRLIIRITGKALVRSLNGSAPAVSVAKQLTPAESTAACSDYFDAEFADLGITGGTVKLVHDADVGTFRVVTEFTSPVVLRENQLKRLVSDTLGQWSDGIGEGCFNDVARRVGVSIDLASNREDDIVAEQVDDGNADPLRSLELAKAARDGDLTGVTRLLDEGADSEVRLQGYAPLHLAVLYGRIDVSLELIRRNADVNAKDPLGQDPLMLTAAGNQISDSDAARIARALLEHGADVHEPRDGDTPLYVAEIRGKTQLAALFRQFGAQR